MRRIAGGTHSSEHDGGGVEPVKTAEHEKNDLQCGNAGIKPPQDDCGFLYLGPELVLCRPHRLSAIERRSLHTEGRKNRDEKHDDTHAAQPVRHVPPEKDSLHLRVDSHHRGGSGRGETGHDLEIAL